MYVCRLFHRDQPFEEIDARLLDVGTLSVGRDPTADWPLDDPNGTLSRIHFTLAVEDGSLLLTDSSTNGTFLANGERAPRDVPIPIATRETLRFGTLSLLVDRPAQAAPGGDVPLLPAAGNTPLPGDWLDGAATPRPRHRDESLIEAFCEGAKLDSSMLSGEDPAQLMRRLGALYQQAVLGVATLLSERARFKGDHALDRTTIGAAANNPFKWAPTRRLAQSLLCEPEPGFLGGAEAMRASFEDIAHHLAGLSAGANAALLAALAELAPEAIEKEASGQRFSLRSGSAVWRDIVARRHAELSGGDRALVERAFTAAYLSAGEEPAAT